MHKIRIRKQVGIHNMIFEYQHNELKNTLIEFKYTYDGKRFYKGRQRKLSTTKSGKQYFLFKDKKIYL